MQINRNTAFIPFNGKIIDTHAHVGRLNDKYYSKDSLDTFTKSELPNKDKDTVEKMYVSSLDVLSGEKDEYNGNKELLKEFDGSDKYELLMACNPKSGNVDNIKKLYNENPNSFIGLKFHPTVQDLSPVDEKYEPYMNFADKKKLPCVFHTAVNVDGEGKVIKNSLEVSDPTKVYELAKKHKDTPIIMAHMGAGWNESHDRAIEVMKDSIENGDANLYADISWVDIGLPRYGYFPEDYHREKDHVLKAIKTLKGIGNPDWKYGDQSYRLMFGSDTPIDRFAEDEGMKEYTTFIDDIKFAIRNDEYLKNESEQIIDDLFYNNAKKLYLKEDKSEPKPEKYNIMTPANIAKTIGSLAFFGNPNKVIK